MIHRERGQLVAECDECGESTEHTITGETDFHFFVADIKRLGWQVRKDLDGDEWQHVCPDCRNP